MYTNNHLDCIVNALDHIYQKREQYKGMRMLKILRPGSRWHYVGVIGVIALILTLSFYGGVAGRPSARRFSPWADC